MSIAETCNCIYVFVKHWLRKINFFSLRAEEKSAKGNKRRESLGKKEEKTQGMQEMSQWWEQTCWNCTWRMCSPVHQTCVLGRIPCAHSPRAGNASAAASQSILTLKVEYRAKWGDCCAHKRKIKHFHTILYSESKLLRESLSLLIYEKIGRW